VVALLEVRVPPFTRPTASLFDYSLHAHDALPRTYTGGWLGGVICSLSGNPPIKKRSLHLVLIGQKAQVQPDHGRFRQDQIMCTWSRTIGSAHIPSVHLVHTLFLYKLDDSLALQPVMIQRGRPCCLLCVHRSHPGSSVGVHGLHSTVIVDVHTRCSP
jgi:hypothetical protein